MRDFNISQKHLRYFRLSALLCWPYIRFVEGRREWARYAGKKGYIGQASKASEVGEVFHRLAVYHGDPRFSDQRWDVLSVQRHWGLAMGVDGRGSMGDHLDPGRARDGRAMSNGSVPKRRHAYGSDEKEEPWVNKWNSLNHLKSWRRLSRIILRKVPSSFTSLFLENKEELWQLM